MIRATAVAGPSMRALVLLGLGLLGLEACRSGAGGSGAAGATAPSTRERASAANNVGVALLEQLKYPEAASAFRGALDVDGTFGAAHLNLSLALLYGQDFDGADREAADAESRLPSALQPPYVRGLVARAQNRNDAARTFFERVRQSDARDAGARVNLAQIALEQQRYSEAIDALTPVVAAEPYHVTATYVLGLALVRAGRSGEGEALLARAQDLRRTGYAITFGTGYLEQGRYAEAIGSNGSEPGLVEAGPSRARLEPSALGDPAAAERQRPSPFGVRFAAADLAGSRAADLARSLGGAVALLDVDGDGDLDAAVVSESGQRLLRHDQAAWSDATAGSGFEGPPAGVVPVGVLAADVDNDGRTDLFVLRDGGSALYRNDGGGRFSDVTRAARLPPFPFLPGAAAFVDVDHDGDVDLLVAGLADVAATRRQAGPGWTFPNQFAGAPLLLLRNNRDGTFTDITREAGLVRRGHAVAVVPTDYDNHRDVDLLIVYRDAPPALYANQRDGTFRDVGPEVGLGGLPGAGTDVVAAAAGDVNKDDWPDVLLAGPGPAILALSDGRGRFTIAPAPDGAVGASGVQLVDVDSDGLLDVVAWHDAGPRVIRNLGAAWRDEPGMVPATPAAAVESTVGSSRALASGDVDGNGRTDLVAVNARGAWLWRNSGDDRNASLRVALTGRVSNRMGVGAKIQIRAGGLTSRLEVSSATPSIAPADLVFGLGPRPGAEVARVLWPSGILQAEVPAAGAAVLRSPFVVEELDRKPSSCPFLFTWNGTRFEFVTDFLGGGEMGDWVAPGEYNRPDPIEFVRIRGDQLVPRDGRFDLRITNELEETLFLDRVQLLVVSHPADVGIFPNEGMTDPPKPERLVAARDLLSPARVTDEHGHDVTDRTSRLDRTYPDDFTLARIRGYAAPHSLTFDVRPSALAAPVVLLTGWTDYAFSSDNVAARQAGLSSSPPALEVRTPSGAWRPIDVAIGIPVGRPQTIPLDLQGKLRPNEHELRLSTSMRIYWDEIQVGVLAPAGTAVTAVTLDPRVASLEERGFSAEVRPDGREPARYDYTRVTTDSPWKAMAGFFTRVGDVRALLAAADDRFVIAKPGDQIALSFDAPGGLDGSGGGPHARRTFLLKGDGFSKEMDPNSGSPYTVEPLPFHGMTRYPFAAAARGGERPDDVRYREIYNTRQVVRALPPLKGTGAPARAGVRP